MLRSKEFKRIQLPQTFSKSSQIYFIIDVSPIYRILHPNWLSSSNQYKKILMCPSPTLGPRHRNSCVSKRKLRKVRQASQGLENRKGRAPTTRMAEMTRVFFSSFDVWKMTSFGKCGTFDLSNWCLHWVFCGIKLAQIAMIAPRDHLTFNVWLSSAEKCEMGIHKQETERCTKFPVCVCVSLLIYQIK